MTKNHNYIEEMWQEIERRDGAMTPRQTFFGGAIALLAIFAKASRGDDTKLREVRSAINKELDEFVKGIQGESNGEATSCKR